MPPRVCMYLSWDREAETAAPLGDLNNRFPALFELRRVFWPRYEHLAGAATGQDIEGYLQAIFTRNYDRFAAQAAELTGSPADRIERRTGASEILLTDALLDTYDTVIVVGFDAKRTHQAATVSEVDAVRRFLARSDTMLFVCPHHDIGDTDDLTSSDALDRQNAEYLHHGDAVLAGQQRTGGFALSLLAALGAPLRNRFGLRPAAAADGKPAPFQMIAVDRHGLLNGVPYLNLHPHLPHFELSDAAGELLEVLVRQTVSPDAPPHPEFAPGSQFDAILQSREDAELGRLIVCDPTLWTSTNGGVDGLEILWKNVCSARGQSRA